MWIKQPKNPALSTSKPLFFHMRQFPEMGLKITFIAFRRIGIMPLAPQLLFFLSVNTYMWELPAGFLNIRLASIKYHSVLGSLLHCLWLLFVYKTSGSVNAASVWFFFSVASFSLSKTTPIFNAFPWKQEYTSMSHSHVCNGTLAAFRVAGWW